MQHRDEVIFKKIISEIDVATGMMNNCSQEDFLKDEKLKRAVSMTIINIGELIKNVTDEMKSSHKEIPWKAAAGLRDVTAHKYQTLRMEDVYNTAVSDLPKLKTQLLSILNNESND